MSVASAMLADMESETHPSVARVVVDVATRALTDPFDYAVPEGMAGVAVGAPVLVPLGGRRVVGYVFGLGDSSDYEGSLRPIEAVLGDPVFGERAPELARWIAREYVCTLADSMRLFLPPGGSPSALAVYSVVGERPTGAVKSAVWDSVTAGGEVTSAQLRKQDLRFTDAAAAMVREGLLTRVWRLKPGVVGAVDDRWVELVPDSAFVPAARAHLQRAALDALVAGPVRVAELTAQLGAVDGALRSLAKAGAVRFESRRRMRGGLHPARPAPRHGTLSDGQNASLTTIAAAAPGAVVLLEGVTGSGKTEVYMRAIERVTDSGQTAIVLVPEISLTPQTVGRFRSRFGEAIAVLHSRLTPGERYDQWDRVRSGEATVVIGPRSALFAPLPNLGLVVIDEEHDSSYKQGSAPRYHARAVAEQLCAAAGAVLVLGSATPALESLDAVARGRYERVALPDRVAPRRRRAWFQSGAAAQSPRLGFVRSVPRVRFRPLVQQLLRLVHLSRGGRQARLPSLRPDHDAPVKVPEVRPPVPASVRSRNPAG